MILSSGTNLSIPITVIFLLTLLIPPTTSERKGPVCLSLRSWTGPQETFNPNDCSRALAKLFQVYQVEQGRPFEFAPRGVATPYALPQRGLPNRYQCVINTFKRAGNVPDAEAFGADTRREWDVSDYASLVSVADEVFNSCPDRGFPGWWRAGETHVLYGKRERRGGRLLADFVFYVK
ncbi:MAG: hypothetical protein Q9219_007040 [cf. Caloplaca sp. 3 TL-2023]